PAPTVRQGGYRVQRTVRRRGGKRSVASRDERGDAGAAGGDIRGKRRGTGEGRRVTAARVAHGIWGPSAAARVARLPLLPLAGGYWAIMKVRAARGRADAVRLPLPPIAVGNLSVGGTGKTPPAAWSAHYCVARGRAPGTRLRGYGGHEGGGEGGGRHAGRGGGGGAGGGGGGGGGRGRDAGLPGATGGQSSRGHAVRQAAGACSARWAGRGGGRRHRRPGKLRGAARGGRRERATRGVPRSSRLSPGGPGAARAGRRRGGLCCSH